MQFHVDMDAFYASVERLDRPELADKPVIVGAAPGNRGVVSTCSYEARAFGVHSAMPISEAVRLCPEGIFLPVRMERYLEMSRAVMEILGEFSPDLRQISVDEAFLDMTGTEGLWGPVREAATRLKDEVRNRTGLTVSVGAASNRYIAKIASGFRKPDGLTIVPPGGEEEFMSGLPIGKLWGAGEKTQERFRELGIRSVPQLRAIGKAGLAALFGNAGGAFLYAASCGQDPGIFRTEAGSRSMSTERTFGRDLSDPEALESLLLGMAQEISHRAWREGVRSKTVFIKLRYADFRTLNPRRTGPSFIEESGALWAEACRLFRSAWNGGPVRLLGLGLGNLQDRKPESQGELFPAGDDRRARVEKAVFELESKGVGKVTRARLIGKYVDRTSGDS
jgi:DNA polymerase-4